MLKNCFSAVILVLVLASSGVADAQECTIAVYADPAASSSLLQVEPIDEGEGYLFSMYVVLFTEDTVAAAAYSISIQGLGIMLFIQDRIAGPSGSGLILDEDPAFIGTNVALGECVIGFGGQPIVIEEYVVFASPGLYWNPVSLGPNTNQNPTFPEYVTCNDVQKDCSAGPTLYAGPVPIWSTSFSAIKGLYR